MSKKKKEKKHIFKGMFMSVYKVLDKILITPLSRIIYKLNKILKRYTIGFEGLLSKTRYIITLSLFIAVGTFFFVNSQSINLMENESEILSNRPVEVIYNEQKYIVEGIPEYVDIILIGKKGELYKAKQKSDHKVILDLRSYKVGEYNAKLKYNNATSGLHYKIDPSTITVKISERESAVRSLTYDILNQDKIDSKLNVSSVTLNESEVIVKSSKEKLQKVALVKALIDLSTLEIENSGSFDIDNLPMVAYDANGNVIDNIEIVPSTASAKITVDSHYVELPVKVVPTGVMPAGFAIASVTTNVSSVRVYGDSEVISNIPYIAAEINVDNLKEDKEYKVTLSKPNGIRYLSETVATVNVKIGIESSKEVEIGTIEARNLGTDLVSNRLGSTAGITVVVKGAESIIENIKPESITAYVDLTNVEPGTYELPILVEGQEVLATYTPKEQKATVKITKKS